MKKYKWDSVGVMLILLTSISISIMFSLGHTQAALQALCVVFGTLIGSVSSNEDLSLSGKLVISGLILFALIAILNPQIYNFLG